MNIPEVLKLRWVQVLLVLVILIAGLNITHAAMRTIQLDSAASFPVDI